MTAKDYIKDYVEEFNRLYFRMVNGRLKESEVIKYLDMMTALRRIGLNPTKLIKYH